MATMATIVPTLLGCVVATSMLRRSWSRSSDKMLWRAGGWGLLGLAFGLSVWISGVGRGVFTASALLPIAALGVIARGRTSRPARAGGTRRAVAGVEPGERAASAWRGVLRWSLAGPVGMVAAMAVGTGYAAWGPGEMQTRLLVGGLLVPVAWACAMAWTLADDRILRATAVLVGTAILGFGFATLRGVT